MSGYETSPFGDSLTAGSGNVTTIVNNHYGERVTDGSTGHIRTAGALNELSFWIDLADVNDDSYKLLAPVLPVGANIEKAYIEVTEAFTVSASGVIDIGTETSEATNGFTITETQAETVGTHDVTAALSGTWAASAVGLVAETTLGLASTGTFTVAGKMKVIIRYTDVR